MYRLLCVIAVSICVTLGQAGTAAAFKRTTVGNVFHDFTLNCLDGAPLQLFEALGQRATVVVFWATWNPRSLDALRDLQQLHERFGAEGLAVLSVNVDGEGYGQERRDAVTAVARDLDLSFPVLIDEDLAAYHTYGVMAVPSIAVAGPGGTVVEAVAGYAGPIRAEFHEKVLTALGVVKPTRQAQAADNRARGAAEHYLRQGRELRSRGHIEKAIANFTRAVAEDPFHREACQTLASALLQVGRLDEAGRIRAQVDALAMR